MSRVEVTNLVPGTLATSVQTNETILSFESACGAGGLGANNIRVEGVTRRTIDNAGDVVEMEHAGYFHHRSSSGPVNNTTGTPVVVGLNLGADPMVTPDLFPPVTANVMVHAVLVVTGAPVPVPGPLPQVTLWLERSTDGGATWMALFGSRRRFSMRDTSPLATGIPGCLFTCQWSQWDFSFPIGVRYRVSFQTVNGDFSFSDGRISCEVLLS